MPSMGFTEMFKKMINIKEIKFLLNTDFFKIKINYYQNSVLFTQAQLTNILVLNMAN